MKSDYDSLLRNMHESLTGGPSVGLWLPQLLVAQEQIAVLLLGRWRCQLFLCNSPSPSIAVILLKLCFDGANLLGAAGPVSSCDEVISTLTKSKTIEQSVRRDEEREMDSLWFMLPDYVD